MQSRKYVRDGIKYDTPGVIRKAVVRLQEVTTGQFPGYFADDVTFVPVPRSAPLTQNSLWVPMRICEELRAAGLGGSICPGLVRIKPVAKSAFAGKGNRPEVTDHIDSIEWRGDFPPTGILLLVDDVVTKGSVMAGCAAVLRSTFPGAEVAGFAMVRTMGLVSDVAKLVDPCTGRITYSNGNVYRRP